MPSVLEDVPKVPSFQSTGFRAAATEVEVEANSSHKKDAKASSYRLRC